MNGRFGTKSNLVLGVGGALLFAGVAAFMAARAGSSPADGPERLGLLDDNRVAVGELAPDFALLSVRSESEVLRLTDFRGKAVVVNFYASWCGPCRQELPDFEAVSRDLAAEVAFIAVNVQESRADALGILSETGTTFPAVLDTDGEVARRYGLRGMPSTYLLDADGRVRKFGPGALAAETLRSELRAIIDSAE